MAKMKHTQKFVSSHLICVDIPELNPFPSETNIRGILYIFLRPFWGGFFDKTWDCQHFSRALLEWKMLTKRELAQFQPPRNLKIESKTSAKLKFCWGIWNHGLDFMLKMLTISGWKAKGTESPKKNWSLEEVYQWKKSQDGWSLLYNFL